MPDKLTNFAEVREEVAQGCLAAGRSVADVTLICVSKTVGLEEVADCVTQGATDFGENRPEQLAWKAQAFPSVRWHFIGNIQSRQIPTIVAHASYIHSVCSLEHVVKINKAAAALGKVQRILVEVNVSGEASKSGINPCELSRFLTESLTYKNVEVCGLMTMAPQGNQEVALATFQGLRHLFDQQKCEGQALPSFSQLSMGMSEDWRQALLCGATMVRLGRAIFDVKFNQETK